MTVRQRFWIIGGGDDRLELEGREDGTRGGGESEVLKLEIFDL